MIRAAPQRIILDTHIWLEYLLWDSPRCAPLRSAYQEGQLRFVIDQACADEFARVLNYPQFALESVRQQEFALRQLQLCQFFDHDLGALDCATAIPICKDPNDQKFLILLAHSNAEYLITRDKKLRKAGRHRFFKQRAQQVITLEDFLATRFTEH